MPHFPEEDSKLRATSLQVRRGGNCPNTLEALQRLLDLHWARRSEEIGIDGGSDRTAACGIRPHLITCLPSTQSPAYDTIAKSLMSSSQDGERGPPPIDLTSCILRTPHDAAGSYIIRSEATGTRTVVNYNGLDEMTAVEFMEAAHRFVSNGGEDVWFHFEVSVSTLRASGRSNGGAAGRRLAGRSAGLTDCYDHITWDMEAHEPHGNGGDDRVVSRRLRYSASGI